MMPVRNIGDTAKWSSITGILLHYIQHTLNMYIRYISDFRRNKRNSEQSTTIEEFILSYFNKAVESKLQRFAKLS